MTRPQRRPEFVAARREESSTAERDCSSECPCKKGGGSVCGMGKVAVLAAAHRSFAAATCTLDMPRFSLRLPRLQRRLGESMPATTAWGEGALRDFGGWELERPAGSTSSRAPLTPQSAFLRCLVAPENDSGQKQRFFSRCGRDRKRDVHTGWKPLAIIDTSRPGRRVASGRRLEAQVSRRERLGSCRQEPSARPATNGRKTSASPTT